MIDIFYRNKSIIIIILLCILNSFLINPPSLNFGDQALINLHVNNNFIDFSKKNSEKNFKDFYNDKYSSYFDEKLLIKNHQSTFGIDANNRYIVDEEEVKTLTRILEVLVSKIFFDKIEMEKIFVITNTIILIFTSLTAFILGKQLFSREYGLILSLLISSNVYFNQLLRSNSEQQTLIYPLIFLLSIYVIRKIFLENNNVYNRILLAGCLSLCWLNGYPNTTLVLFPFILVLIIFLPLLINNFNNILKINYLNFINIIEILLIFIFFTISVLFIWSYVHNYEFFHYLEILNTRFGRIFSGEFTNESFINNFNILNLISHFKNLFTVIFSNTDIYYSPHEPQFLYKISYINLIEGLFFLSGIFLLFRNFLFKNFNHIILLLIFLLFISRSFTDRLWLVEKLNYDYFFLIHFFSAYGIYKFSKNKIFTKFINLEIFRIFFYQIKNISYKIYFLIFLRKNIKINNTSNIKEKNSYIYIIFLIFLINSFNFNFYFINKFNENLGQHNGIYEIKKFIKNNLLENDDLLIIDWRWGDVYYPALLTNLEGKYNWDVLSNKNEIFNNTNYASYYKKFENVYIISTANFTNISYKTKAAGGRKILSNQDYKDLLSYGNFYKIIKDRNNRPIYNIHKLSSNLNHKFIDSMNKISFKTEINLKKDELLNYIDLPANIKNIDIICDQNKINYDFSQNNFDYLHLNFVKQSYAEIYNDFSNNKYKPNKSSKDILFYESNDKNTTYLTSQNNISKVSYKHTFPFQIDTLQISTPYLIFNNLNKSNFLQIKLKDENNTNITVEKIYSDGSQKYGNWTIFPPFDILELTGYSKNFFTNYISKIINMKNKTTNFIIEYTIGNSNFHKQSWASRFISNKNSNPSLILNSILINLSIENDDLKKIKSCKNIQIITNYKSLKDNYISYGIFTKEKL